MTTAQKPIDKSARKRPLTSKPR